MVNASFPINCKVFIRFYCCFSSRSKEVSKIEKNDINMYLEYHLNETSDPWSGWMIPLEHFYYPKNWYQKKKLHRCRIVRFASLRIWNLFDSFFSVNYKKQKKFGINFTLLHTTRYYSCSASCKSMNSDS